jgi:hypothetical protein
VLPPSSVQLNLVQVSGDLVRKNGFGRLNGKKFYQSEPWKVERMLLEGAFGSEFQERPL